MNEQMNEEEGLILPHRYFLENEIPVMLSKYDSFSNKPLYIILTYTAKNIKEDDLLLLDKIQKKTITLVSENGSGYYQSNFYIIEETKNEGKALGVAYKEYIKYVIPIFLDKTQKINNNNNNDNNLLWHYYLTQKEEDDLIQFFDNNNKKYIEYTCKTRLTARINLDLIKQPKSFVSFISNNGEEKRMYYYDIGHIFDDRIFIFPLLANYDDN